MRQTTSFGWAREWDRVKPEMNLQSGETPADERPRCRIRLSNLGGLNPPNRRVRTRTHGGVTGTAGDRLPMSITVRLIIFTSRDLRDLHLKAFPQRRGHFLESGELDVFGVVFDS